jgi:hypothetical protein
LSKHQIGELVFIKEPDGVEHLGFIAKRNNIGKDYYYTIHWFKPDKETDWLQELLIDDYKDNLREYLAQQV